MKIRMVLFIGKNQVVILAIMLFLGNVDALNIASESITNETRIVPSNYTS
jgi:hypothetical protein